MNLNCYQCNGEKPFGDFSPSCRYKPTSQIVCKRCRAIEKRKERDADPALKWGRFNFTWKPYGT